MSDSAAEEPPVKKETSLSSSFPLCSLPDELALSCLARVPRSDHKALSFVSKRYRSLLLSSELYKIRSQLGRTEECLYVCISTRFDSSPLWFILRRQKPQKGLLMSPIPCNPFQTPASSSVVVLDWGIYVIGGLGNKKHTSDVWLLDCRTNTWRQVPSMRVARHSPAAGVVGGKIYVFGKCGDDDSSKWGEVFDAKTQTWDTLVPLPDLSQGDSLICGSVSMEEKVYAMPWLKANVIHYSPGEAKWGRKRTQNYITHSLFGKLVYVGKLLYGFNTYDGHVFWCESDEFEWKRVQGLEALHKRVPRDRLRNSVFGDGNHISQVCNFGENIVLFGEQIVDGSMKIWCAEISFERREEKGEVWGRIQGSEVVATLGLESWGGQRFNFLCSVSVSV